MQERMVVVWDKSEGGSKTRMWEKKKHARLRLDLLFNRLRYTLQRF